MSDQTGRSGATRPKLGDEMTPPWVRKLEAPSEAELRYAAKRRRGRQFGPFFSAVTLGVVAGLGGAIWTAGFLKRHFDAVGAGVFGTFSVFALVGVVTVLLILVRQALGSVWTSLISIPFGALVGAYALALFVGLIG
ncbi:hypothetical protein [Brevundimonas sp. FT23028]|uniref:hypothetical protein n=1 Tax=Brevundimonas sp. FT23028 TaxID=3393748 RepID=UPI003B58AE4C